MVSFMQKKVSKVHVLLEDCYEELRKNHFEEDESDVILDALNMWEETYKNTTVISQSI